MFDAPLNIDNATIYKFRIIGNYDDGFIGSLGTDLDNQKTKFLVCEDVVEADDTTHPRHGYRYLVARPKYLWNATAPLNFTEATNEAGYNPINPKYSEEDEIQALALFAESVYPSIELPYSSGLKSYIGDFNSVSTPIMNWAEITGNSVIGLYFEDMNQDARNRNNGGTPALRYLPVWL